MSLKDTTIGLTCGTNRPFSKLGDAGAVYYDAETTLLSEVV